MNNEKVDINKKKPNMLPKNKLKNQLLTPKKVKFKNWLRKKKYILLIFGLLIFGIIYLISYYLTEYEVSLDWLTPISNIGGILAVILSILMIFKSLRKSAKKADIELVKPQRECEAIETDSIKEHVANHEFEIHGGALDK
ncbi:MAG: hypothetical protein LBU83_13280 [Bacteroidales bacterium]|jgi:predicted ferric reductase|nr:hypothetical protein [Bacteroidales bacterium]